MDDRQAIALAYNAVRRTGALDYPAWLAAVAKYRERHPDVSEREAGLEVRRLIGEASTMIPEIV